MQRKQFISSAGKCTSGFEGVDLEGCSVMLTTGWQQRMPQPTGVSPSPVLSASSFPPRVFNITTVQGGGFMFFIIYGCINVLRRQW